MNLNEMENISGGECAKTATKVLMASASAAIGIATGGIGLLFGAWALYTVADTMTSGCEEF